MGDFPKNSSFDQRVPSGKHTKNYGKSAFLMGKPTISMAIFNSFLYVKTRGYIIIYPIKSH